MIDVTERPHRIFPSIKYEDWLVPAYPGIDWQFLNEREGDAARWINSELETGRELFVKDFTTGLWTLSVGSVVIDDLDSFTTTVSGGLRVDDGSVAVAKEYTARVKGTTTASSVAIFSWDASVLIKTLGTGAFDESFTFTAEKPGIFIRNSGAGTTDITWIDTTLKQTGILGSDAYPGPELLVNPNFTAWTGVTPNDQPDGWTVIETPTGGYVTENPANQLQIISDGTTVAIRQLSLFTVGKRYQFTDIVTAHSAGSTRMGFLGGSDNIIIADSVAEFKAEAIADGTDFQLLRNVTPLNQTHDSISVREVNPMVGVNNGAAVGQVGQGNIPFGYGFDGSVTFINDFNAELNSKLPVSEGTLVVAFKTNDWTGTRYIVNLRVDANNRIELFIFGGDLLARHEAGGTARTVTLVSGGSSNDIMIAALTWNSTAVKGYLDSALIQTLGGVGIWVGNLSPTETTLGSLNTTPANVLDGVIYYRGLGGQVLTLVDLADIQSGSGL